MTIELKPETEALVRQEADRQGRPLNEVVDSLIRDALADSEIEFEETMAGIERGWRAAEECRTRPLSEDVAEVRGMRVVRGASG